MRFASFIGYVLVGAAVYGCAEGGSSGARKPDAGTVRDTGGNATVDTGPGGDPDPLPDSGPVTSDTGVPRTDAGPLCNAASCDPLASCDSSTGAAVCTCPAGYRDATGDGSDCVQINECTENTDNCLDVASCVDTPGSFSCRCATGYGGDGRTACTDIDECSNGTHTCDASNATCTNTEGSHTCECNSGYVGDGHSCSLPTARVLVFYDSFYMPSEASPNEAAAALGYPVDVYADDAPGFIAAFDRGGYDVVIFESAGDVILSSLQTRIESWVGKNGKLIFNYWDLDGNASLQSVLGVTAASYSTWRNIYDDPTAELDFFNGAQTIVSPLTGVDSSATDNGDTLSVSGEFDQLVARAGSTSGAGAIAVTHQGRVIVHGFLPWDARATNNDGDSMKDVQELYMNELQYLAALP